MQSLREKEESGGGRGDRKGIVCPTDAITPNDARKTQYTGEVRGWRGWDGHGTDSALRCSGRA